MIQYYRRRIQPFFLLFIGFQTLMRLVFTVKEASHLDSLGSIVKGFLAGAVFDMAAFAYFLIPLALYLLLLPARLHGSRRDRIISGVLFGLLTYILLFTCIAEWFFWDEFTARFNFIAVDYLVYTHEVIGNIRESYPVFPLLAGIAAIASFAGWWFARRPLPAYKLRFNQRVAGLALCAGLAVLSFAVVQGKWSGVSANRYQIEIAKNGMFELFSAFRHNELDYAQFYTTADEEKLRELLRAKMSARGDVFKDDGITRHIAATGPEKRHNIVMITVESLSGNYLKAFGNSENLTPYLDELAKQSLFFTNFYATGTRTVYGLSALTLSIPPLPGNSIVRRPDNEHLFTLGSVLNGKGYVSKFIYGGFGYFDNMNYFFQNNGYGIVDRNSMSKDEITFANVWGVADEDLFRRTIKENDEAHASGKPFFDMIMTTSNHRPFTYPDGKIDIPSKTGRKGGVKYTDYAIKQFIEESRKHAWFDDTIFVIVADHTAGGAGKSELDPAAYHIPLIVYAPGIVEPREVHTLSSQMDVAPTLLGLLNMSYDSRFYGADILRDPPNRALISNYQQLGYLTDDKLVVLKPVKKITEYSKAEGDLNQARSVNENDKLAALSYFQNATRWKEWNKALDYDTKQADAHHETTADRR